MTSKNHKLSIVIIVLQGRAKLARCLRALAQQAATEPFEILVPFDDAHHDVPELASEFPDVCFHIVEGRHTYAELRAAAVKRTGGEIVAITEDHCIPEPDWVTQIVQAHSDPYAAIGGPVEKAIPDTSLNWSLYLADYVRYANPMPAGQTHHLTDCNVTYKRAALDEISDVWQAEFHEPEVHASLESAGQTLWFSPEIVVQQQRTMSFGEAIRDRYAFGRLFGGRRALDAPLSRRLSYMALSLLLPFVLTGRVAQHVMRRRRYTAAFLRALPLVTILNTFWAVGEFTGYLTGRAEASLRPDQQANTSHEDIPTGP